MKISFKWLCELMPGLEHYPAHDLAHRLTMAGLEVETVEDLGLRYAGCCVGEVVETARHPAADKLSVCRVRAANQEFKVVCGAPNVRAGKKYPFAMMGCVLPGGLEIKTINLRGVESSGMLCSAKELELSSDAAGLLELDDALSSGSPLALALGLDDFIFEVNVTPNRGDALSHWGVAAEVSLLTGIEARFDLIAPPVAGIQKSGQAGSEQGDLMVEILDSEACWRFTGSQIFGVKIGPSPSWLIRRLESLGIRSINNVVDATNYVMLLTGHPVHAYDERELGGHKIVVRTLEAQTAFTTLDSQKRDLKKGDIVICDANRPVGLAGIMGGENSEIKDDTHNVVLEVAFFNPDFIRKTARRLGLKTDSSYRFERFVNPETVLQAHEILKDLILNLAGGRPTPIIDVYPQKYQPFKIELLDTEITRILGIKIPREDVVRILKGLQCRVELNDTAYMVVPPSARADLTRPVDLIEELARLYGLDKIEAVMPSLQLRYPSENHASRLDREVKDCLVKQGFHETIHYSFSEPSLMARVLKLNDDYPWIRLKNPISEDMAAMRPSHLPHLLGCYVKNRLNTDKGLRFFELRNIYRQTQTERCVEVQLLSGIYSGNVYGRNRFGFSRSSDLFDGKGICHALFDMARIQPEESPFAEWPFHPGQSLVFSYQQKRIAVLGALHPQLLQGFKIKEQIYFFEIDYSELSTCYNLKPKQFVKISPLPSVYRDLALLVPQHVSCAQILAVIEQEKPCHLKEVDLFDLYEGEKIPSGMKSIAFSIRYEPEQESLTDEVVNQMHFGLVEVLKNKLGVTLR